MIAKSPVIDWDNTVIKFNHDSQPPYRLPNHLIYHIADVYHAFKDVEGFAKVASLADICANDGNLSIPPLYVSEKSVSDEKGEYAADDLKAAVKAWEESSIKYLCQLPN